jgi:hypothetical protein
MTVLSDKSGPSPSAQSKIWHRPDQPVRQPANPFNTPSKVPLSPFSYRSPSGFFNSVSPSSFIVKSGEEKLTANDWHRPVAWAKAADKHDLLSSQKWLADRLDKLSVSDSSPPVVDRSPPPATTFSPLAPLFCSSLHHQPPKEATNQEAEAQPAAESPRVFRPMESKLSKQNGLVEQQLQGAFPPQQEAWARMIAGFSPNYRGNIGLPRNRSADIPAHLNCSLFILNLHADITTHELLANIRDAGRIYATHINAPEPDKGHGTCAAKVIFFERVSAERFYNRCQTTGFLIAGRPNAGRVIWNRIRTAEHSGPRHQSRVLQIAGPPHIVNEKFLTAYFQTKLDFQIDEVMDVGGTPERRVVEYRFGSFRCQAEAAKMALAREWSEHDVKVWFGPDPCDVVVPTGTEALSALPTGPEFAGDEYGQNGDE